MGSSKTPANCGDLALSASKRRAWAEGMALIRTIFAALLFEMSLVTSPAYKEASVEERTAGGLIVPEGSTAGLQRTLARWRA